MFKLHLPVLHYIGRFWLWSLGWKIQSDIPDLKKFVIVGAPHTSNWDFPFGLAMFYALKIRLSWMGKDVLFKPPLGDLMRGLGGLAIERNSQHGVVEQMVGRLERAEHLIIGIAAKGTRKKTQYWKSGFYWIAYKANVPIVCCYLDYPNKLARIGFTVYPTGDIKQDMDKIRDFYKNIQGKRPEHADNIRLKEEDMV